MGQGASAAPSASVASAPVPPDRPRSFRACSGAIAGLRPSLPVWSQDPCRKRPPNALRRSTASCRCRHCGARWRTRNPGCEPHSARSGGANGHRLQQPPPRQAGWQGFRKPRASPMRTSSRPHWTRSRTQPGPRATLQSCQPPVGTGSPHPSRACSLIQNTRTLASRSTARPCPK